MHIPDDKFVDHLVEYAWRRHCKKNEVDGKSLVIGKWQKLLKSSYLDVVECAEHESDSHFSRRHVPEVLEHLKVRKIVIFDRVYWAYMKSYTKIK